MEKNIQSEHERITTLEDQADYINDQISEFRQMFSSINADLAIIQGAYSFRRKADGPAVAGGPINVPFPKSSFTGRGCKKKKIWTRHPDRDGKVAQVSITICNDTTREMDVTTSDGQKATLEGWEKATPEGRPPVVVPDCHTFVGDIRWVEIHFKGVETDRGSGTAEGTVTWF